MTQILDGKAVAQEIRAEVAEGVERLLKAGGRPPGLTAVLVGEDPASQLYVGMKTRACAEAGLRGESLVLPKDITAEALLERIAALNADDAVDGILVQLPLPDSLPEKTILQAVSPEKDVDGFHPINVGRLWSGEDGFVPATPAGVLEMLKRYKVPLSGSHAVVVGRSRIVGKPMAALLLAENCTVTICHSRTRDLAAECRRADILIAAVGRAALIGPDHVKEGAWVVDVGTNRISDPEEVKRLFPGNEKRLAAIEKRGGTVVGDVFYTAVKEKAAVSPVPGGVGPLTVAMLLVNTLKSARLRQGL
jgi:methylenetetrahydrofolate dehydrogenase (NADP+)/methenyltetrahydrofolate cyclohydrolase